MQKASRNKLDEQLVHLDVTSDLIELLWISLRMNVQRVQKATPATF